MSSPRCTLNRWGVTGGATGGGGTGGGSSTSPKTSEAKEMEDKLKKMMAEREKVDMMWSQSSFNNSK
jgi:hypothetical protein